jgi:hypothetical protein
VTSQASLVSDFLDDRWSCAIVDAAWLHDIGHSPAVSSSGFHPLDGARWLREQGFSMDTCSLVAWHTGAIHEARERGLEDELRAEFATPAPSALDALTWADLTSSPTGDIVSPTETSGLTFPRTTQTPRTPGRWTSFASSPGTSRLQASLSETWTPSSCWGQFDSAHTSLRCAPMWLMRWVWTSRLCR